MRDELLEKVRCAENLPTLPVVAVEILRLTRQDASVEELAGVIQQDPTLAAKLLKLVNSPLFGVRREVCSIKQAVSLLGLRTVKVMALSFSLVETIRNGQDAAFDFQTYWRRSLSTASTARLLGKAIKSRVAEEAFVAGLLSDIGILAAWWTARDRYLPVVQARATDSEHLSTVELKILGVSHAELGAAMLRAWGLPEELCSAVIAHHGDTVDKHAETATGELTRIVHCAATIADLFCQELPPSQLDQIKAYCVDLTGIEDGALEELLESLDTHVQDAANTLNVQVGDVIDYTQLQAEASAQLVRLSMLAEVERAAMSKKEQEARLEAERLNSEKKKIMEMASTDGLTGVANRAAFDQRLEEELQRAASANVPLCLIIFDVDHFKRFNDTHGHQAGDAVLRAIGQCVPAVVSHHGFVARYGGEEFAVIVPGNGIDMAGQLAESIRQAIAATRVRHGAIELAITASFGVAPFDGLADSMAPTRIIESADRQLYEAKRLGRNRVVAGGDPKPGEAVSASLPAPRAYVAPRAQA